MSTSQIISRVSAAARLHLGFLDPDATLGRRFGSVGVSIADIATTIEAEWHPELVVEGEVDARVLDMVERLLAHYRLPREVRVRVLQRIPGHAGLGSGTQLALAVGTVLARHNGRAAPAAEIGHVLGRGRRSGTGLGLFEHGGLVVDAGHATHTRVPPVVCRLALPQEWRVVLIFDHRREGLSGSAEVDAFRALAPFAQASAAHLCHLTLMGLLPAVAENDFAAFAAAVGEIQAVIGDHFAAVQSGRYTSAAVAAAVQYCVDEFALRGVGQSSWGPTGFVFVPDAAAAAQLLAACEARFAEVSGLAFQACALRNAGATIERLEGTPNRRQVSV